MIEIDFVQEPVKLRVDMNKFTMQDALDLQAAMDKSGKTDHEMIDALSPMIERLCGQPLVTLPLEAAVELLSALQQRMNGGATPAGN